MHESAEIRARTMKRSSAVDNAIARFVEDVQLIIGRRVRQVVAEVLTARGLTAEGSSRRNSRASAPARAGRAGPRGSKAKSGERSPEQLSLF